MGAALGRITTLNNNDMVWEPHSALVRKEWGDFLDIEYDNVKGLHPGTIQDRLISAYRFCG